MESVGARLKELRLQKGLTLDDVHKKTKLHLNILKAIEDDSLVGINPIYIRGFLKIYCKFLGVDPKDYIADYKEPQAAVKLPGSADTAGSGVPGSRRFKFNIPFNNIKMILKLIVVIAVAVIFIKLVVKLGRMIFSKRKAVPVSVAKIPAVANTKAEVKKADKRQSAVVAEPKKEVPAYIRLGLRARDNSWVDLKVDGRTVFRGELKKGKFESWQADNKIELSLGNAGGIELELDGRVIPPLGRKNQGIKGIRITKEEGLVMPR